MPKAISIPVVVEAVSVATCGPAPGAAVVQGRRRFLGGTAVLSGLLVAGTPLALLAPGRAWALDLTHADQHQADVIMALAKTLYPHKTLPDAVYALAVKDVDAKMSDAHTADLVKGGVARLDQVSGDKWLSITDAQRTAIVTAHQGDPFVQLVRAQCITSLYNNDMAFAHFGYQGEAFSKGGYLRRGFNDLNWLPNPPADASPPVA